MATQTAHLRVQQRSILGKQVQQLRNQGLTPIHVYGRDIESLALQVESASLWRTLEQVGRSQPVTLEVEGQSEPYITFVRDVQFHPLNNRVLHVDFIRVDVSRATQVDVPIYLDGEAPAARFMGGSLIQTLRIIRLEALPLETPEAIIADVTVLTDFGKSIHVSDLQVPPTVTVLTDPDQLVARVNAPIAAEVTEAAAAAAEAGQEPEAAPEEAAE
jgi:large subunit ribosomal protein L25